MNVTQVRLDVTRVNLEATIVNLNVSRRSLIREHTRYEQM